MIVIPEEREILEAIAAVLASPRDRYRRPEPSHEACERVRDWLMKLHCAPHGGLDTLDQCSMLLQYLLGQKVESVLEKKR